MTEPTQPTDAEAALDALDELIFASIEKLGANKTVKIERKLREALLRPVQGEKTEAFVESAANLVLIDLRRKGVGMIELLKMIEEVDPADTAKLDEIDARVCDFIEPGSVKRHKKYSLFGVPACTRSRDALKAIRPPYKHIYMTIEKDDSDLWYCVIENAGATDYVFTSPNLITEELAELHAIIQAIAYERAAQQGGGDA